MGDISGLTKYLEGSFKLFTSPAVPCSFCRSNITVAKGSSVFTQEDVTQPTSGAKPSTARFPVSPCTQRVLRP